MSPADISKNDSLEAYIWRKASAPRQRNSGVRGMTVSLDQFSQLLSNFTDYNTLVFQDARRRFNRKKLFQYCAAIANKGGGSLVLGVTGRSRRKVVGTRAFPDLAKIEQEAFARLSFRVDVVEVKHPDGRVVVFNIPSRPQGTAYTFEGVYLICSYGEILQMPTDMLRAIFAEGRLDFLDEPTMSNLDAQTIIDLLDTQSFFDLQKLPYPSTSQGVIDKLVAKRLIDRSEGSFSMRRMGALLLAKRLSDFDDLSDKAPRVVVHHGRRRTEARKDWPSDRGYAVGFNGLVDFVMVQLSQYESMKLLTKAAVKELIANALIHQDFTVPEEGIKIEIYSNRIEISNPGVPILEIDHFIDDANPRNERLARIMRRMYLCEARSVGVARVIDAVENSHLPAPEFRVANNRTRVVVYGARSFKEMAKKECVRACFQHCVFRSVNMDHMTNETLRNRFDLPASKRLAVSAVIEDAVKAKLIKKYEGRSRKHARYVPYWL